MVNSYIDCYNEWIKTDQDKRSWCNDHVKAVRGMSCDERPAETIRINLSHIEWAEENILGGASACASIAHIIKTKSAGKKPVVKDTTTYKVRTINGADLVKELVANGVERKTAITIAKNMRFV